MPICILKIMLDTVIRKLKMSNNDLVKLSIGSLVE